MEVSSDLTGSRVDIAPFGLISYWTGADRHTIERHDAPKEEGVWRPVDILEQGGSHIGLEWECPRRFSEVVIRYAEGRAPLPGKVKLQYWNHTWPEQWAGGWTAVEDPYNGRWVTAHDNVEVEGKVWRHTFDPLDIVELPHAEDFPVTFRQSLKLRLLFHDDAPRIENICVLSDSIWRKARLRIELGLGGECVSYGGGVEIYNGYLISIDDLNPKSVLIDVLFADVGSACFEKAAPLHPDSTIVTVKCTKRSFSFQVTDALDKGVYVPDLGVFIAEESFAGFKKWRPEPVIPIYDRVTFEPEQTYERAEGDSPVGEVITGTIWKVLSNRLRRQPPRICRAV